MIKALTGIELAQAYIDCRTSGMVEDMASLCAVDLVLNAPPSMPVSTWYGYTGVAASIKDLRGAFPEWRETVVDLWAVGDKTFCRTVGKGIHRGQFLGIEATGKSVEMDFQYVLRSALGRLSEIWYMFDILSFFQHVGADETKLAAYLFPDGDVSRNQMGGL